MANQIDRDCAREPFLVEFDRYVWIDLQQSIAR
jgi:hypothetical protein